MSVQLKNWITRSIDTLASELETSNINEVIVFQNKSLKSKVTSQSKQVEKLENKVSMRKRTLQYLYQS